MSTDQAAPRATGSVVVYYLLALGISWAGWIPFAASRLGVVPFDVPWEIPLLAQFGPSVAALLLTRRSAGRVGVRDFLGQALRWRISPRWYLIALFTTPAIAMIALVIHAVAGHPVPGWSDISAWPDAYAESFGAGGVYAVDAVRPTSIGLISSLRELIRGSPWLAAVNFLVFSIVTGPVSEEFGWRGYALPRLAARRSLVGAALVVGVMWGFWHTGPDFWRILLQGDLRAFLYPAAMTAGTLPLAVLFAWMYTNTDASLLPVMLFHASFNATLSVLGLVWVSRSSLIIGAELVAGLWLVAIAVIARYGASLSLRTAASGAAGQEPPSLSQMRGA
jgi:membrane protease YdiL (CAAX protease family)